MNILLSGSESHPIGANVFTLSREDKRAVLFYGLAKKRGDNVIASSRVTDAFYTVLENHNPRLAYYEIPELDPVKPQEEAREHMAQFGIRLDFVGIAFNLRKDLSADAYKKLLEDIAKAIE